MSFQGSFNMHYKDFSTKVGFGLSFCLLFSSSISFANPQIQPKAISSLVTDIDKTIAVGERGHAFVYKNTWQQVETPVSVNLTNIEMLDDKNAWAVGHDATIIHSQDAGATWVMQAQSKEVEKPFLDVTFFDSTHGIAVGAYGLFYRTKDGGKNWQEEFHLELLLPEDQEYLEELKEVDPKGYEIEKGSLLPHFNRALQLSDGRLLLVGELGTVAVSDDQGTTFKSLSFPYEGSMFNAVETDSFIYVVGLRGNVFKADKALSHWQKIPMPSDATIQGVYFDKNELLLVGNSGVIYSLNADDDVHTVKQIKGVNLLGVTNIGNQIWIAGTNGLTPLDKEQ